MIKASDILKEFMYYIHKNGDFVLGDRNEFELGIGQKTIVISVPFLGALQEENRYKLENERLVEKNKNLIKIIDEYEKDKERRDRNSFDSDYEAAMRGPNGRGGI